MNRLKKALIELLPEDVADECYREIKTIFRKIHKEIWEEILQNIIPQYEKVWQLIDLQRRRLPQVDNLT
jgi:hypothetical protein